MNSSFCIFIVGVHACFQVFGSVWSLHDFPACRDRLAELKMTSEVCRWLRHLSKPCQTACECVASLGQDSVLKLQLLQAGAL